MPRKKPVENAGTGSRKRTGSMQPGISEKLMKVLVSQSQDPWKYADKSVGKTFYQMPKSKKR
jgi:hypothetical protein